MGPHGRSEGSQAEDRSLRVDVSHPESLRGTRYHDSNHGDGQVCSVIGVPLIMCSVCGGRRDVITSTIVVIVVVTGTSRA